MFIIRFFCYWPFLGKLNYLIIFIKDKNGEGEITSHFTLIDTGLYGTYFWVVKTCLLTNKSSNTLLVCISNTLDDVGEGVVSLYKKPLVLEDLFKFFTESSASLFPLFQWNFSYTLLKKMWYISFSWKGVSNITYLSHLPVTTLNTWLHWKTGYS